MIDIKEIIINEYDNKDRRGTKLSKMTKEFLALENKFVESLNEEQVLEYQKIQQMNDLILNEVQADVVEFVLQFFRAVRS